jgi:hypothetical protein
VSCWVLLPTWNKQNTRQRLHEKKKHHTFYITDVPRPPEVYAALWFPGKIKWYVSTWESVWNSVKVKNISGYVKYFIVNNSKYLDLIQNTNANFAASNSTHRWVKQKKNFLCGYDQIDTWYYCWWDFKVVSASTENSLLEF